MQPRPPEVVVPRQHRPRGGGTPRNPCPASLCLATAPPTWRRGVAEPRPLEGVACGAREAAGGGGSVRTASRQVGSLLTPGFRASGPGRAAAAGRPRGAGIAARAVADAGPSQAAVRTGTGTRAPPARPGCAVGTRAPPHKPRPTPRLGLRPLSGVTPGTPVAPVPRTLPRRDAPCCPASPPSGLFGFFLFRNRTLVEVTCLWRVLAEDCGCRRRQQLLRCLPGSPLLFPGRCLTLC